MRRAGAFSYALAVVSAIAALAGLVVGPDWIERLTGASPDGGDGRLELAWVLVPMVVALFGAFAGRRLRGAATGA
jgi:hypothetical protein